MLTEITYELNKALEYSPKPHTKEKKGGKGEEKANQGDRKTTQQTVRI